MSYSATDKEGNKVGKPFKSSIFGKEAGIDALEKRMQVSAAWAKKHKDIATDTAARIAAAMQTAGHDRALFERELLRQGIGVVFRQNEAGRIYGATFIDHADKTVFNGSRLGKEFSANVFNDLFAGLVAGCTTLHGCEQAKSVCHIFSGAVLVVGLVRCITFLPFRCAGMCLLLYGVRTVLSGKKVVEHIG